VIVVGQMFKMPPKDACSTEAPGAPDKQEQQGQDGTIGSFHLKTVQKFQFCNPPSQNLLIFGTHEPIHEV